MTRYVALVIGEDHIVVASSKMNEDHDAAVQEVRDAWFEITQNPSTPEVWVDAAWKRVVSGEDDMSLIVLEV